MSMDRMAGMYYEKNQRLKDKPECLAKKGAMELDKTYDNYHDHTCHKHKTHGGVHICNCGKTWRVASEPKWKLRRFSTR